MFWEPTSIIQPNAGYGTECFLRNGKARPLSLQLKPMSIIDYSTITFTSTTPFISSHFDTIFTRTITSPISPRTQVQHARVPENTRKACPSIINTLPTEILCLIFEEYLMPSTDDSDLEDVDIETTPSVSSDFNVSPLPLTHVCRHWRSTAIAQRKLWGDIAVSIKPHATQAIAEAAGKNLVRLLRLFLSRAGGMPLNLSLASHSGKEVISNDESALSYAVLQLLIPHCPRWRSIKLQLRSDELQRAFWDSLTSRAKGFELPELRSLVLDLPGYDEETEERTGALIYDTIFRNAPNLSHLIIDEDLLEFLDSYNLDSVVPWSSLEHLDIACHAIPCKRLLAICQKAVNLETLSIWRVAEEEDDGMDYGSPPTREEPVLMSSLRELKATLLSRPQELLSSLCLPSIQKVELDLQGLGFSCRKEALALSDDVVKPLEQLLEKSSSASLQSVHYRVKTRCLADIDHQPVGQPLLQTWAQDNGFKVLGGLPRLEIDLYKY